MKKILILLVCVVAFSGCKTKREERLLGTDFESLMGKGLSRWVYVQTKEDFDNLSFFKTTYEKNISLLEDEVKNGRIPKTLHWIWIGPKSFPRESIEYVRSWLGKHPDWTCYFWTDRKRPVPHPSLKIRYIQDLTWEYPQLKECCDDSTNWAEKSDVLRIEILSREGGIYVDHDVQCIQPFDPLVETYDLFCGMELPFKTALESCVLPTNNIIAARPGHPILSKAKVWLMDNWKAVGEAYPGNDSESVLNRVAHRTFAVIGRSFKQLANTQGNRDIALPTMYFNAPKEEWALFAQHKYAGTWYESESKFEKNVKHRLMYLSKKANKTVLYLMISTLINVLGFGLIATLLLKRKRA